MFIHIYTYIVVYKHIYIRCYIYTKLIKHIRVCRKMIMPMYRHFYINRPTAETTTSTTRNPK